MYHVHKQRVDILLLQETHFKGPDRLTFCNKYYTQWIHCLNPLAKTRGVSIAIHKNLPSTILETQGDDIGRLLLVKLSLYNSIYTIAKLYFPNQGQVSFGLTTLSRLRNIAAGNLIAVRRSDHGIIAYLMPPPNVSENHNTTPASVTFGDYSILGVETIVSFQLLMGYIADLTTFLSPLTFFTAPNRRTSAPSCYPPYTRIHDYRPA